MIVDEIDRCVPMPTTNDSALKRNTIVFGYSYPTNFKILFAMKMQDSWNDVTDVLTKSNTLSAIADSHHAHKMYHPRDKRSNFGDSILAEFDSHLFVR